MMEPTMESNPQNIVLLGFPSEKAQKLKELFPTTTKVRSLDVMSDRLTTRIDSVDLVIVNKWTKHKHWDRAKKIFPNARIIFYASASHAKEKMEPMINKPTNEQLTALRNVVSSNRAYIAKKTKNAAAWLREYLSTGTKESSEVYKAAARAGFSRSNICYVSEPIRGLVRVTKQRIGFGGESTTYWKLEEDTVKQETVVKTTRKMIPEPPADSPLESNLRYIAPPAPKPGMESLPLHAYAVRVEMMLHDLKAIGILSEKAISQLGPEHIPAFVKLREYALLADLLLSDVKRTLEDLL